MSKHRFYLVLTAVCCVLLAALLAVSAVGIYLEGSARRAENPLENIYTPEAAAEKLGLAAPLFFFLLGLLAAGAALGIRDENADRPAAAQPVKTPPENPAWRRTLQLVCLAAAAALIVAGILNGSALDVLVKAITICTECVGLG